MTTLPGSGLPGSGELVRMRALLDRFAALKAGQRELRYQRMAGFLKLFEEQHYMSLTTGPVEFNLFEALRVADYEIRHSAFLAWLLDARAEHKQGTRFLLRFLEVCEIDHHLGPRALPTVRTEHREVGAFIDIVVYVAGELLVYIENKLWATDREKQLKTELEDMRKLGERIRVPEDRWYAVYLTLTGKGPKFDQSGVWQTLSYGELVESFATVLPESCSEKLRYLVEDWIAVARQKGGSR